MIFTVVNTRKTNSNQFISIIFSDQCEEEESVDPSVRRRIRTNYDRKESSTHQGGGYFFPESDEMIDNHNRRLRSTSNRDAP